MKIAQTLLAGLFLATLITACSKAETPTPNEPSSGTGTPIDTTTTPLSYAKGADVSWLTEMEQAGKKFYNTAGEEKECIALLRDYGIDAIRLRVWVNPADGWCNKNDVIAKAQRAHQQGMRIMIDFHYSDNWADPGKQYKPQAWAGYSLAELKDAITTHTQEVLNTLKENGITPEWVQIGNELGAGMLWDTDRNKSGATYDVKQNGITYPKNEANFAAFITTGSRAAKAVFPTTKTVVHIQNGQDYELFKWIFDMLKSHKAEYDIIGMSLYPEPTDWQTMNNSCISNIGNLIARYNKEVMICEVGMSWDSPQAAKSFLTDLITRSSAIDRCLGIFYWEPQCYGNWKGYSKGAFDNNGKPTAAMNAFKTTNK